MARFSYLLVVFLLGVASTYAQVVDVHTICQKAKNPSFCLNLLNSKPGPKDLVSLAQYTIGVDHGKAIDTVKLISTLIAKGGSNANLIKHYKSCLSHFGNDGALGNILLVEHFLETKDYASASTYASAAMTDVDDCISGESPGDKPIPDPSQLPQYAQNVYQVTEIVLIISNLLNH